MGVTHRWNSYSSTARETLIEKEPKSTTTFAAPLAASLTLFSSHMAPCQLQYCGSPPPAQVHGPSNVSISPPQTRPCARVWINVERFRLLSRHRSLPAAQCSALVAGIRDAVDSPLPPPTSASCETDEPG